MASIYDLKPRFQALLRPAAAFLARTGVTANQVTIAAVLLSLATGAALLLRPWAMLLLPVTLWFVDVFVGEPVEWTGTRESYLEAFRSAFAHLAALGDFPIWE